MQTEIGVAHRRRLLTIFLGMGDWTKSEWQRTSSSVTVDYETCGILVGRIYSKQQFKSSYLPELFHNVVVEIPYASTT